MKQFQEFEATSLFCAKCRQLMPVNKRLLLILPDSELWEYLCEGCGRSVGTKKVSSKPAIIFTGENIDNEIDSY